MIIYYGTKSKQRHLANFGECECEKCGTVTKDAYVRIRKWFHIYALPLIPYSTKYYRICPVCSWSLHVSKIKNLDGLMPIK